MGVYLQLHESERRQLVHHHALWSLLSGSTDKSGT
jgi:hypothetical protein